VRFDAGDLNVVSQQQVSDQLQALEQVAEQPGQSAAVVLQAISDARVGAAIAAVNGVAPPTAVASIAVTLNLGGQTLTTDTQINAPAGVTLVIQDGTLVVGSPALVVDSGTVVLDHVTATSATDAPTIVMSGGSLTVRNSTIEASSGHAQTAIVVAGGNVDLGAASNPGGITINVNDAGAWIQNSTLTPVAAVGDTFAVNGALASFSLSGLAFSDFNHDGQVDFGEAGIVGVTATLTGTDDLGGAVNLSQTTDSAGTYVFLSLRPDADTISETQQPAGYTPGVNSVGTSGESVAGNRFSAGLPVGAQAMNFNYGEQPAAKGPAQAGQTAGVGFWNNKNGQALIKGLNGGVGTRLGDWLAASPAHERFWLPVRAHYNGLRSARQPAWGP
jgi:hypothetical protein